MTYLHDDLIKHKALIAELRQQGKTLKEIKQRLIEDGIKRRGYKPYTQKHISYLCCYFGIEKGQS
jgi:hypothetical protein